MLVSPDPFTFLPAHAFETEEISFQLKDDESFHKVMEYIKKLKGNPANAGNEATSELLFHAMHQNCAAFAKEIADYAIKKTGATKITSKPAKLTLKKMKAMITHFILNIAVNLPGVPGACKGGKELLNTPYANLRPRDLFGKTVLLPADLPYSFDSSPLLIE